MRRVVLTGWRVLLLLAGLGLVALAVLPWIDVIEPWVIAPLQSFGRFWIVAGAALLLVCLVSRAWIAAGLSAVAIAAALVPLINFSGGQCAATDATVHVMSLNTEFAGADQRQIIKAVHRHHIDLLVLAESDKEQVASLMSAGLGDDLPYIVSDQLSDSSSSGTVLWSRYALTPVAGRGAEADTMGQPAASFELDDRTVIVRAVHTYPPLPQWVGSWRASLRQLGEWQRSTRGTPLVMMGDFNGTRGHPAFRDAAQGLSDPSGWWARSTWPADKRIPPFATIDHILSRGFASSDFSTVRVDRTDHLGIRATLHLCAL